MRTGRPRRMGRVWGGIRRTRRAEAGAIVRPRTRPRNSRRFTGDETPPAGRAEPPMRTARPHLLARCCRFSSGARARSAPRVPTDIVVEPLATVGAHGADTLDPHGVPPRRPRARRGAAHPRLRVITVGAGGHQSRAHGPGRASAAASEACSAWRSTRASPRPRSSTSIPPTPRRARSASRASRHRGSGSRNDGVMRSMPALATT